MNNSITNNEINSLGTLNAMFLEFFYACLTLYSTGDNQCGRKPVDLLQCFGLLWCGKQINKLLVFCCSHLTFLDIFVVFMWLNAMYCFVLSLRIKYDVSINRNSCVMRTISIVSFDSIENHKYYLCLGFFFRIYSIRYIVCFRSEDKILW